MDCVFGYPEGYDPATGALWDNGDDWFEDEDGDYRDPMYDQEDFDYPENPATPGFKYGIDPSTGLQYNNHWIDDTGEIQNPVESDDDDEDEPDVPIGGDDNTPNLEPCADPDNTYRPAGQDDCIQCDASHCDNWPPPCENGDYRPEDGALNDKGYIDCIACATVDCPDFVVPECNSGDYRPLNGSPNS